MYGDVSVMWILCCVSDKRGCQIRNIIRGKTVDCFEDKCLLLLLASSFEEDPAAFTVKIC